MRMALMHSSESRGESKGGLSIKGRVVLLHVVSCVVLTRWTRASWAAEAASPFFRTTTKGQLCFVSNPTSAVDPPRRSCSSRRRVPLESCRDVKRSRRRRNGGLLPPRSPLARLAAVSTDSSVTTSSKLQAPLTVSDPPPRRTKTWFPTRIQDAMSNDAYDGDDEISRWSSASDSSYEALVQRLYLRHVVVETREVAHLALDLYQQILSEGGSNDDNAVDATATTMDPFGHVAKLLSVDAVTASSGGTVGWVDVSRAAHSAPPATIENDDGLVSPATASSSQRVLSDDGPLSNACLEQVVAQRPKAGDVCVIQDLSTKQWHVVLVAELWLQPSWMLMPRHNSSSMENAAYDGRRNADDSVVGGFRGQNRVLPRENRRFKGRGVMPEFPSELRTYKIQTAGCQMNVADSERLAGILAHELRLKPVTDANKNDALLLRNNEARESNPESSWPDVLVLNTCSIRDKAEQKVYNALGPYCAAKRQGQRTVIVVTGCVAQQEGQDLLSRIPEVDAVVGPQYIPFLKNVIDLVSTGQQVVATSPMMIAEQDMNVPPVRGHDVRAWVNVIYGCNEHCTYCVVPATRGTEQSRSMEAILAECLDLASRGYKEITLIGQNIDAYGRDMVPKRTFADLLYFLNARLPNPMRIRYVTSHPRYFGQRVVDAVASLDKVCECFHMPFQAGDDDVLKRMRRGYTYDSYLKIIGRIREKAPDASITTDIIVGFPGESEEAFQKTLQLMEAVRFDNVNSFAYSPRPNTEAALWTKQRLPDDVVADRLQRVQALAAKHGLERSLRYVGRTEEVLVEDANPRSTIQVMGRTRQGRQVYFDGNLDILRGHFVRVRITEARTWSLVGELVEQYL